MSDPVSHLNSALEGRYKIERELGEGGMATVYLARDEKHNRNVALKVLKRELAAAVGAERFLAEIKTTASLQHPHLLPLHDSGEADGFLFYVMPYVDGESLRERLDREHQLPIEDAVRIASDVAEALDYAHRRGVIHRDIKPANILLQDGKPVVADFGIALALSSAGGHRLTETGLSMGTPHYMSPEQATGEQRVGRSTDIWALGCVLYEMLVGEPPYTASTPQAILGRIITAEVRSAIAERPTVPAGVDAVIRKALEKLPADRFTGADALAKALTDPGFRHGAGAGTAPGASGRRPFAIAAAGVLGFVAGAAVVALLSRPPDPPPFAASITLPEDVEVTLTDDIVLDVSPDGMTLAYNGTDDAGQTQIYLHALDGFEAQTVPGSSVTGGLNFSHDGQWIAFAAPSGLRRTPVAGGPSLTVCTVGCGMTTGDWTEGDEIIFTFDRSGLFLVPASGGARTPVTTVDSEAGELDHDMPQALPGGGILYGVRFATGAREIRLHRDGRSRTVLSGARQARYTNGRLLYVVGSSLLAVDFDPADGTTGGEPVEVVNDLRLFAGRAAFAVGEQGTLVYVPESTSSNGTLVRVSRDGAADVVSAEERGLLLPRLSPQDSTLLLFADGGDVRTFDVASGLERQLTLGGGINMAIWAPDDRVIFQSARDGFPNLFIKSASERDDARRLLTSEDPMWPDDVTPDGTLVFSQGSPVTGGDIWTVRLEAGAEPTILLGDEFTTWPGGVSPDGRWLAYVSDEPGEVEVYVSDFPDLDNRRRVSIDGGTEPVWSPVGGELFYRDGDRMMVVAYQMDADGEFAPEPARELFVGRYVHCCTGLASYAVAADGQSVFMLQRGQARAIRFLRGWESRVRR